MRKLLATLQLLVHLATLVKSSLARLEFDSSSFVNYGTRVRNSKKKLNEKEGKLFEGELFSIFFTNLGGRQHGMGWQLGKDCSSGLQRPSAPHSIVSGVSGEMSATSGNPYPAEQVRLAVWPAKATISAFPEERKYDDL